MSKNEIKAQIENLESRKFLVNMVDRWTEQDRQILREINKELDKMYELVDGAN